MAELLVVVDSKAKAQFMKEYYRDRADCIVCEGPLFKTSHQISSGAPSGLLFHFDGFPAAQPCLDALHDFQDKEILLALDENAPANYLCWQIRGYVAQIGGNPGAVKRLAIKAFSNETIDDALRLAWPVDARLGLSFYSHQLLDDCLAHHLVRLVGTDRGPGNLALRKNSLTTLFLLAEREHERSMFPLVPKWQVQAKLGNQDKSFTVSLAKGLDLAADGLIMNEAKARTHRDQFWQTSFRVDSRCRLPLMITAPEPYQLAELLHDALVLLDLNPTATMDIVRKLFHGAPVSGKIGGFISSPVRHEQGSGSIPHRGVQERTPTHEAEIHGQGMIAALRRQVATLYGEAALLDDCAMPTLGMIIPVNAEQSGADLAQVLSQDEVALYDLIRMRALASQMRPAVGTTITIDFLAGKENIFQAHFHELDDPGFLQTQPAEMAKIQAPIPVAEIKDGQEFKPIKVTCEPIINEGQCAERYTIDTLLAALSDFSIAPDLSTITMLDDIIKAGYATISKQGYLKVEENTAKVITILDRAFPRMQGINLAAYIEQTITEAASARKDLPFALKQFDQTLMLHGKILVKAKITAKVQPRARTSSTIIKQAVPTQEVTPSISLKERDASTPTNELLAPAESKQGVPPQIPIPSEPEQGQEPIAAEYPSSGDQTESMSSKDWTAQPLPEETALTEEGLEADRTSSAALGSGPPAEEAMTNAWPEDDFQKVFAEALSGTPQATEASEEAPSFVADGTPRTETSVPSTAQDHVCPACGKPLLLKEDTFGVFWKCSGFPGCRYSEATAQTDINLVCPLCDHGLDRKQTPTGKSFYVCGNQECQFMSWSIPHYLPCGLCDSPYLVEKTVRGIPQLRCPRAGCPYGQPLPEENLATTPAPMTASPVTATVPATKKVLVRRVAPGSSTGGGTKKVRIVRRRT